MANEQSLLRIKAENLGTVGEIRNFLADMEDAYNGIYTFDFLVEIMTYERSRSLKDLDNSFERTRNYLKDISYRKDYPLDPFFYEFMTEGFYLRKRATLPNLLEFRSQFEIEKIVPASERLTLSKVNIQSPGFWEFIGSLNPLQQIREYLKDRHERKKDTQYRNRQERIKGDLDILEKENSIVKQRIDILKSMGYSDVEIRPILNDLIVEPLKKLDNHQDIGLIDYPED